MKHPHNLVPLRARRMLVLLAVTAGVVFSATPAAAHASLIDSNPEDGATLAEPPEDITLEFSESVQGDFVQVAVLDSADSHHEDGEPVVAGSTVTQAVDGLAAGKYRISFRVGSSDGHPVTGVLAFTVSAPADEDDEPSQPSSQTQPPQQDPSNQVPEQVGSPAPTDRPAATDDEESGSAQRWLGAGAAVAAAAALLFALLRRPGARDSRVESDTGPQ